MLILPLFSPVFQILMELPNYKATEDRRDVPFKALLTDPYIVLVASMVFFSNSGYTMIEPTLPIHMIRVMKSKPWQLGMYWTKLHHG